MAELEKPGEQVSQPVAAPPQGQPQQQAGETAPQEGQPPPTPTLPEKFKGKSAEEIATAYLEIERDHTKKSQEAAELRRIAEQLYYESLGRTAQSQAQPPQPERTEPEFNWEKPVETVEQIVERKLGERQAVQAHYARQGAWQRAAAAHDEGRSAMSKNPKLYEGIEGEVEQAVFQGLAPYAIQGYDVSEALVNPKTWEAAAALLRVQRGQYDHLSFAPQPMSAQSGELPSQTRQSQSSEPEVQITDDLRQLAREMGIDDSDQKGMRALIGKGAQTVYKGIGR